MQDTNAWQQAKNILCVRLDTIGDVLMTTPAMRALKESGPRRRITLLTSVSGAAIAELVPEVDETIVYDAPWLKHSAERLDSTQDIAMADLLRERDFDAAVIFTVFSQNPAPAAFLCYLADIPLRLAHSHEQLYQLLTTRVPDPEPQETIRHEVRRQLDLVAAVGAVTTNEKLSLQVPEAARTRVHGLLRQMGLGDYQHWAVMHTGATAASRRWAPESFAEAARLLAETAGVPVVLTGSEAEREQVAAIQEMAHVPTYSLAGELDLAELAALLEAAPLLISNNSGPVHMAAALGTPVVDLYALTNPQHTPWAVPNRVLNHDVPCKFCYKSVCPEGHHNCLRLVTPQQVVTAALELLDTQAEPEKVAEELPYQSLGVVI